MSIYSSQLAASGAQAAPRFEPPRRQPARDWPRARDWIGSARRDALELFPAHCYDAPVVAHQILGRRLFVINDLAAIQAILGPESRDFALTNMHRRMLGPALRGGVIVAEGEPWRRHRRASLRLLDLANELRPASEAIVEQTIDGWVQAGPIDLGPAATDLSIRLLAAEIFGYAGAATDDRLLGDLARHRALIERIDVLDVLGAPTWLPSRRMRRARALVTPYYTRIDAAARDIGYAPPTGFTARGFHDLVVNLMVGYESVAATVIWFAALLAQHPELATWLRAEGDAEASARRVELAIVETLRLYPPLPLIFRRARRRKVLPACEIPAGALICISPYLAHRNRSNFADPDVFVADRFATLPGKTSAFLAFSHGARACPGRQLAPRLITAIARRIVAAGLKPLPRGALAPPRAGISLRPAVSPVVQFGAGQ
ncbi:MAG: cytochrome P450 [Pseudomonadota bacterium]